MIRVLIAGGTGFIGRHLAKGIVDSGGEVTLLTRSSASNGQYKQISWRDHSEVRALAKEIENYDLIVNLSGASIDKRWSESYKEEIIKSRVDSTAMLVRAINSAVTKPKYFVNASAVGYYGDLDDGTADEDSGPGNDFLASLCIKWEDEARKLDKNVKLLIPRFGVVMGKDGGAFAQLIRGARNGISFDTKGKSAWKSWIHVEDAVYSIIFMTSKGFEGVYNAVSPSPLKMEGMMQLIANQIGRKARVKVGPRATGILLGEGGRYSVFSSQKVLPKRLLELGFQFKYPDFLDALSDLLKVDK